MEYLAYISSLFAFSAIVGSILFDPDLVVLKLLSNGQVAIVRLFQLDWFHFDACPDLRIVPVVFC